MAVEDLFVPSATENCQVKTALPKGSRTTLQFPVVTETTRQMYVATFWTLAGLYICAFLSVVSSAVAFSWAAAIQPLIDWAVLIVLGIMFVGYSIAFRCVRRRWSKWEFFFLVGVPVGAAVLACCYCLFHRIDVLLPASAMLLAWQGLRFRWFYATLASLGMFDERTRRDWLRRHRLPRTLRPRSPLTGAVDALACHFAYNRERVPRWVPGLWVPWCGADWRRIESFVAIVLLSATTVRYSELLFSGLYTVLSVSSPLHVAATLPVVAIVPLAIWLGALFLISGPFSLGKAYALKSKQFSPGHWRRFMDQIRNSPDKITQNSFFFGRTEDSGAPILIPFDELFKHLFVLGRTRTGKSAFLTGLLDQAIYRGDTSVVVLDLKSFTAEILASIYASAKAAELKHKRPFPVKHFTLNQGWSTYLFDIFSQPWWHQLPPIQRTGAILGALNLAYSAAYGKSYYRDAAFVFLAFVLKRHPGVQSWAELAHFCREAIRSARPSELDEEAKRDGRHIVWVIKRFGSLSAINAHPGLSPDVARNAINFSDAFVSPGIFYFDLSAIRNNFIAGDVGRFVVSSLLAAACATPMSQRRTRVILVADEFHEMLSEDTAVLFSQSSGLGVSCWVSAHSSAQLVTSDFDLRSVVESNTACQVFLSVSDEMGMSQVGRLGGKMIDVLAAETINARGEIAVNLAQHIVDRVDDNLIAAVTSDRERMLLRAGQNAGYWATNGLMTSGRWMFHQTAKQFKRCEQMSWPAVSRETLVNGPLPPATKPTLGNGRRGQTVVPASHRVRQQIRGGRFTQP